MKALLIILMLFSCTVSSAELWLEKTTKILMFEEGFRSRPYHDSQGYPTVGFGDKLSNTKWEDLSKYKRWGIGYAKLQMQKRIKSDYLNLQKSKRGEVFNRLGTDQKVALLSMSYQMGWVGITKFNNTWLLLGQDAYYGAALSASKSLWYKQTRSRAKRTLEVLAGWPISDVYTHKLMGIK